MFSTTITLVRIRKLLICTCTLYIGTLCHSYTLKGTSLFVFSFKHSTYIQNIFAGMYDAFHLIFLSSQLQLLLWLLFSAPTYFVCYTETYTFSYLCLRFFVSFWYHSIAFFSQFSYFCVFVLRFSFALLKYHRIECQSSYSFCLYFIRKFHNSDDLTGDEVKLSWLCSCYTMLCWRLSLSIHTVDSSVLTWAPSSCWSIASTSQFNKKHQRMENPFRFIRNEWRKMYKKLL